MEDKLMETKKKIENVLHIMRISNQSNLKDVEIFEDGFEALKRLIGIEFIEEFFNRRFPEKDIEFEKMCGYFQEWEERFNTRDPRVFMDEDSKKVYETILSMRN